MTLRTTSVEVRAPQEQSEGTRSQILRWLKVAGETVTENEPLLELETDKVTVEIPAPATGVLQHILKQERETIEPGELLAHIHIEVVAGSSASDGATDLAPVLVDSRIPSNAGRADARGARETDAGGAARAAQLERASPAVKRLLAQYGLVAEDVRGTGDGGRITVDDVLRLVGDRGDGADAGSRGAPVAGIVIGSAGRLVPHTAIRRRTAEHMVHSLLKTAPHVTTVFEADFSALLAHRAQHRGDFAKRGASLTLTAYFLAACVDAIRVVPEVNARWHEDSLELLDSIDIGVGTSVEGKGLVVPVVHAVQALDLFHIAQEVGRLVACAREGRLTPNDVRGGTFTISNHGVSGSLLAAPIVIHQPQVAILGIGKLQKRPVVVDHAGQDQIVVQPRCYLTLTIDHRAMDGDRANRFLEVLVRRLEYWPLATPDVAAQLG